VDQQKKPASRSLPPGPANTQRVLRGKRDEQGSIKGIPRRIGLHAFVSRLAKETTEDDLSGWLNNVGIKSAKCRKIVPKDGRVFQSAAFQVSCDITHADIFTTSLTGHRDVS